MDLHVPLSIRLPVVVRYLLIEINCRQEEEMKIAGVAPQIAIPTFLYMLITIIIDQLTRPLFQMTQRNDSNFLIIGILLILFGVLIVVTIGKKLLKSFHENILMTEGLYKIFRNPMYVSYLIFIIPGIGLVFNSWLVFTAIIINFILFQIYIKKEYRYLEEKYGEQYKLYLKKVWCKYL
jgi:protein-S-isoprenylcysteine O-methyltransferase Ste14